MSFFHETFRSAEEFDQYVKEHPGMTYAELAQRFPQPEWCRYPDAVTGIMGCWSLMGFKVSGRDFCRSCDQSIVDHPNPQPA